MLIVYPFYANAAGWTLTAVVAYQGGWVCEKYEWKLLGITWSTKEYCYHISEATY